MGVACSHAVLKDPPELVAEAIVAAVIADRHTALPFVGRELIVRVMAGADLDVTETFYFPTGSVAPSGAYVLGSTASSPVHGSLAMLDLEAGRVVWQSTSVVRPSTDQPGTGENDNDRWNPSAAFNSNGDRVAITATTDRMERMLEIRDVATGSLIGSQQMPGLTLVRSVAENSVVTVHDDGTVWRWSWQGDELAVPQPLCAVRRPVTSVVVSWDGVSLAIRYGMGPGTILLLRTAGDGLLARIVPILRWAWTLMAFAGRYFFWTIPGMPVHVLDRIRQRLVATTVASIRDLRS